MKKGLLSTAGLGLGVALFFAGNLVAGRVLGKARVDLTEEKLFTLSDGARNIAAKLEEPVQLYLYFSEDAVAEEDPQRLDFGNRVKSLLEEFERAGDGKLSLEVVDPEPFSDDEDQAIAEGLRPVNLSNGDPFFLGVVGADTLDNREVIPFVNPADPTAERYLEYDLARMLHQLSSPERPTVGVLSTLPMEGAPGNPMMGQQGTPSWRILDELRRFFEVEMVATDATEIDAGIDVLMVVHPRELGETTQYALDQFVVSGKPAMFFVDPHCENDQSGADPTNPMAGMFGDKSSDLNSLFGAWGFEVVGGQVVGDRGNAARVRNPSREPGALPEIEYPPLLLLREDAMAEEDAVSSALQMAFLPYAGAIQATDGATTTLEPLLQTGEDSMLIDAGMIQSFPEPEELIRNFVPEQRRLTLAARVTGEATSAFPGGLDDATAPEDLAEDQAGPTPDAGGHVERGDIHVVVVSDADLLADSNWIREERMGPISLGWRKVTDNGDLALNALEGLAGGEDLALLRVRSKFHRPFETFEEMQQAAEQDYLDEQVALEAELQSIQERINELQREKSADQQLILSPEQQVALEEAQEKQVETRKRLRDVRLSLRKDIDGLQTQLKAVNMAGVPVLVLLLGVAVALTRSRRRS